MHNVHQLFLITTPTGSKYKIKMPQKYVCNMLPHNLATVQSDIDHEMHPYVVYRKQLSTNEFYFNIIRKSMFSALLRIATFR